MRGARSADLALQPRALDTATCPRACYSPRTWNMSGFENAQHHAGPEYSCNTTWPKHKVEILGNIHTCVTSVILRPSQETGELTLNCIRAYYMVRSSIEVEFMFFLRWRPTTAWQGVRLLVGGTARPCAEASQPGPGVRSAQLCTA